MKSGAFQGVLDGLWESVAADLEIIPAGKVLCLGSGTDGLIGRISARHRGVDVVEDDQLEFLRTCQENSYDLVMIAFLLCYVRPDRLFELTKRVLRPGGRYIILTTEREGWSDFEGEFWKFLVTHVQYVDLLKAFNPMQSFAPRLGEMDKLLRQSGYINIRIENKLVEKQFSDPVAWLKWMDRADFASNYIRLVRDGHEDYIIDELAKYCDRNQIQCYGVPIEYGKPFTFRWKILYATAER